MTETMIIIISKKSNVVLNTQSHHKINDEAINFNYQKNFDVISQKMKYRAHTKK